MEARPPIPPQALDSLVRKLGHDVRGSLFVLDGCLEMAEMGAMEPRDLAERLRQVQTDLISRLDGFTESVRVLAVAVAPLEDSCSLHAVLDEVAGEAAVIAAMGDVRVERGACVPLTVAADPWSLRRLLLNLILRGVRQARSGEAVRLETEGARVRISHPERRLQHGALDPGDLLERGELELAAALVLAEDLGASLRWGVHEGQAVAELELRTP